MYVMMIASFYSCLFPSSSLLQAVIEELRVDAVERRCKIDCNEIDALLSELKEHQSSLQSLQGNYYLFITR